MMWVIIFIVTVLHSKLASITALTSTVTKNHTHLPEMLKKGRGA